MATFNTIKIYDLNGTSTDFPVPFEYMARRFVQVTLLGTGRRPLTLVTEFVFTNPTTIRTLTAWGRQQGYTHIEVRRVTSATDRIVSFNDATILRASDLNAAETQSLHIAEEARDSASEVLGLDADGNLDARSRRIVNLADPINPGDAMTLRYYQADRGGLSDLKDLAEAAALAASASAEQAAASAQNAVDVVNELLINVEEGTGGFSERYGRSSIADIPNLMRALRNWRYGEDEEIIIVSFGSSVGVGANVPAGHAPGDFFVQELNRLLNPAGIYRFRHINLCVNGSQAFELPARVDYMVAQGIKPALALTFYGMNCQQPAIFNSGPTLDGLYDGLNWGIQKLKALSIDPVIYDTPHASITNFDTFVMPPSVPMNYPKYAMEPVLPEQMIPPASQSGAWITETSTGESIYMSHRALRVSEMFATVAARQGVPLVSAQRGWFRGMALLKRELGSMSAAEYASYGTTGEFVHPNVLGNKISYWAETTAWLTSVARGASAPGSLRAFNGYLYLNNRGDLVPPPAVLAIDQPWPDTTTPGILVRHRHGPVASDGLKTLLDDMTFDPETGDMLLHGGAFRVSTNRPYGNSINDPLIVRQKSYGAVRRDVTAGGLNLLTTTPLDVDFTQYGSDAMGTLWIACQTNGAPAANPMQQRYTWVIKDSGFSVALDGPAFGSDGFTLSYTGKVMHINPNFDNTNVQYTITALSVGVA